MFYFYLDVKGIKMAKFEKKILNFRSSLLNSKWNLLFDIYNHISKKNYLSLIKIFLNHIKVQFKDSINNNKMCDDYRSAVIHRRSKCSLMWSTTILAHLSIFSIDNE